MKRSIDGVSVVIPTLNAMPYVRDALDSVLHQSWRRLEVIVVDGGSTDGTIEFVKSVSDFDPRVRLVIQHEGKIGEARNIGIREARYDWIACLDSDDIAYPKWLEKGVEFLNRNPEFVFVSCDTEYIDQQGRPTGIIKRHKLKNPPYWDPFIDGNVPHQGSIYSKTSVLSVGGYRDFPQGEDYDLFLRLSEHYTLGFIPEVLTGTRILQKGLTLRDFKTQRIYWMYAKDCAIARRSGKPEPMFDSWLIANEERIRRKRRKWNGQRLWTMAGAYLTQRKLLLTAVYAIGALLFNPEYVINKLKTYKLEIIEKGKTWLAN